MIFNIFAKILNLHQLLIIIFTALSFEHTVNFEIFCAFFLNRLDFREQYHYNILKINCMGGYYHGRQE